MKNCFTLQCLKIEYCWKLLNYTYTIKIACNYVVSLKLQHNITSSPFSLSSFVLFVRMSFSVALLASTPSNKQTNTTLNQRQIANTIMSP